MIRAATPEDAEAIWLIIWPVINDGETYALDRDLTRDEALQYWMGEDKRCYVAEQEGVVQGTYYLTRNQGGGGGHVCNCGYMVAPKAQGRGLASAMCAHSLEIARRLGFRAMQFNFVVATNDGAIRLWERHGFNVVGRLPMAFEHPKQGFVDALIMHKVI